MSQRRKKTQPTASRLQASSTKANREVAPEPELVDIDYDRLRSVSRVVKLEDLMLADAGFASLRDPRELETISGAAEYQLSLVDARWWRDARSLDVGLGYRVHASIPSGDHTTALFEVRTRWVVCYSLPDEFEIPKDAEEVMADFVAANAQVNVFPYVRQHVNDVSARAGWPPLVMAVFKAPAKRPRMLIKTAHPWPS